MIELGNHLHPVQWLLDPNSPISRRREPVFVVALSCMLPDHLLNQGLVGPTL